MREKKTISIKSLNKKLKYLKFTGDDIDIFIEKMVDILNDEDFVNYSYEEDDSKITDYFIPTPTKNVNFFVELTFDLIYEEKFHKLNIEGFSKIGLKNQQEIFIELIETCDDKIEITTLETFDIEYKD